MTSDKLNGAAETPPPWLLVLSGGKWLLGRPQGSDGPAIILAPVFEYVGAVMVRPSAERRGAVDIQVHRNAAPLCGLVSLKGVRVVPSSIVPLADLDPKEARDIIRAAEQCETLLGSLRADMAGIVKPRIVV
jgi:hypothetical protein